MQVSILTSTAIKKSLPEKIIYYYSMRRGGLSIYSKGDEQ